MTAKRAAPAKKAKPRAREPETKRRTDAEQAAYEQGRKAQLSAIARRDAPHGKGALRDAWQDGWDFQSEVAF